ncbi:MAG: sigma-70 family RNA polymerase sigma factor [Planctomycetes bacterium]|nr:sigma-70 family RNA polymerase sigma factor [Planctomycetota bacterium]
MHESRPDRHTLEADFAAFARDGDPAALGRVFDRCAARLLVVARHLAVDDPAAEDLVQSTFVVAIRQAARHDVARPLLPWLCGILAREAAASRRADARRARRDGAAAPPSEPTDPADEAERAELAARVAASLDALPPTYREVVNLRLLHGLEPIEIARALERPQGTVRSQLQRGLAMLRTAWARGIGVPAAIAIDMTAGECARLSALRERIVTAAVEHGRAAATTTAATVAGTWISGAIVIKGAWIAATVLAALWLTGEATSWWRSPALVSAEPVPGAEFVRGSDEGIDALGNVASETRSPMSPPGPLGSGDVRVDGSARLLGRAVDAGGIPIAGLDLEVSARGSTPARTSSGVDGRFDLRAPIPVAGGPQSLRAEGGDCARRHVELGVLQAGEERDLGDVVVPAGAVITGRITETSGAPRAGLQVDARLLAPAEPSWPRDAPDSLSIDTLVYAETDATGRYTMSWPAVAGRWTLRIMVPPDLEFVPFEIPVGVRRVVVDATVPDAEPWVEIRGEVVDERGDPVERAQVALVSGNGACQSDAGGRFSCRTPRSRATAPVHLRVEAAGFEPVRCTAEAFSWGADTVRIVLLRGLDLDVLVVDGAGRPRDDYALRVFAQLGDALPFEPEHLAPRWPGPHPAGRVLVGPLGRGTWHVQAVAGDGRHSEVAAVAVDDSAPRTLTLTLRDRRARDIVVLDGRGEPVAGAVLELLSMLTANDARPGTLAVDLDAPHGIGSDMAALLDRATTDAAGRASLRGLDHATAALRVAHAGFPTLIVPEVSFEPGLGPLAVTAARGASLVVTLQPAASVDQLFASCPAGARPALRLRARQGGELLVVQPGAPGSLGWEVPLDPASAGAVELSAVPAGDWDLELVTPVPGGPIPGFGGTTRIGEPLAAVIGLRPDERRALQIDLGDRQSVELRGRLVRDGAPLGGERATLRRIDVPGCEPRAVHTDADGRFTLRLPSGTYELCTTALESPPEAQPGAPAPLQLVQRIADGPVIVAPPGPVEHEFVIRAN